MSFISLASFAAAGDLRNFEDAALRAIQFIDDQEGWAVGDEGVVWHTVNGGAAWERQPTGTRASLRDLHFLNPYTGWIAGREELPHGRGSAGVLLRTSDGGLTWSQEAIGSLPGLNRVRFVGPRAGFVVGDGSDQYPGGVFCTADAGRSWQPIAAPRSTSWLGADFQDSETGVLAGAWGRIALLRGGSLHRPDMENDLGPRALCGLQVVGKRALAVGQGGLVLLSPDNAGGSWGYAPNLHLPPQIRSSWDFHALHCAGTQAWVVGRPGSVILHTRDLGETWEIQRTGQPLPLNSVFFLNASRGWAAGELGQILGTQDGGRNWKIQRSGGQRAALLLVHARPDSIPLPSIAIEGGQQGYLAAAVRLLGPDFATAPPSEATAPMRLAEAVRQSGGASSEMIWQFPVPEHLKRTKDQELMEFWNKQHGEHASEQLLLQLVLALRIWRPSVVITDSPEMGSPPCDRMAVQAVREAFRLAADPKAFPEQIDRLDLKIWEAQKLYCLCSRRADAEVVLDLGQPQARLQATALDFAAEPMAILSEPGSCISTFDLRPSKIEEQGPKSLDRSSLAFFHLLESRLPGAGRHADLMQGTEPVPDGVMRRKLPNVPELSPSVEKAIRARRSFETLAQSSSPLLGDPGRMLAQVGPMLAALPDHQAAEAAFAVANRYAQIGQWNSAREIFVLMTNRYPSHPLTGAAYRWLIRHDTSSEVRRREELCQFWMESHSAAGAVKDLQSLGNVRIKGMPESRDTVRQASLLSSRQMTKRWYQDSVDFGTRLSALGSIHANDPAIQFCLQAARRHLGEIETAREWYTHFHAEQTDGPWRDAAAAELWIGHRVGNPPKKVITCFQAPVRPYLDGNLDDDCWRDQPVLAMQNAAGETLKDFPTQARLAYDKDFLYLSLKCGRPASRHVSGTSRRGPDADVENYDHVSLLLDLDRDYSTYFRLQVDQRGCVSDDCWGDRSWNPRWFVAQKTDPGCWQVEAAIPMTELTGDSVSIGRIWACNIVRTIPGQGIQAWSLPAASDPPRPEGMGLLMFMGERNPNKPMSIAP
jgi:photosystem II stability/assembly factor-like uncharacterized protein/LmbE family N-acetylglucosaminyl deacetylase